MLARDLISEVVPAVRTSDTGLQALNLMEVFRISHLPIVNHNEFLGLVSDNDIYDMNMADEPLGNHTLTLQTTFIYEYEHIYNVIKEVDKAALTLVPVLSEKREYMGSITQRDLLSFFARITAVDNPGGIIILQMSIHDYSASEITYIVEANDAKVLSMYITSPENSTRVDVTLKTNKQDISDIEQAFTRHAYDIKGIFSPENKLEELNQERYDSFMRYLNI